MTDSVEQRLRDLETLVLRQAERVDDLEARLTMWARIAMRQAIKTKGSERDAA